MVGLVFLLILIVMFLCLQAIRKRNERREEEQRRKREEFQRIKSCGEVVLFFANHLGYIARSCVSREELAELIDTGITAPELAGEISRRIADVNGITLGYHPFGEYPLDVKLPKSARERHIYIIGKSGYGKTNLLRTMILQDMEEGNGIGVIAPEQEMLTEEILPYVPDHRLDDVIYFNPADTEYPVSFNPLHLDEGEDLDLKVDETFTILRAYL